MSEIDSGLLEELKSTWEGAFKPLSERLDAETKRFGDASAETRSAIEEVNKRLDQIEVEWQKARAFGRGKESRGRDEVKLAAFLEVVRKGFDGVAPETKDMVVSIDTQGGFLVPEDYRLEIIKGIVDISPIRQYARVLQTSRDAVTIPKRTGRPTAAWVSETGTRTETGSTYGQERIPVHELACYVDISNQLLEDSAFDIDDQLRMDLVEEFAETEGLAFVSGDGVGKPEGLMTNADVAFTVSGDADEIKDSSGQFNGGITLMHALKPRYAANGTWVLNFTVLGKLRTLKDSQNQYIWQPGSIAGDYPATILGRPYAVAQDMPAEGANTYPILFGDLQRAYHVVDRVDLAMQRDPFTQATNGLVRFVARRRVGGQVVLPEAVRKLKCST